MHACTLYRYKVQDIDLLSIKSARYRLFIDIKCSLSIIYRYQVQNIDNFSMQSAGNRYKSVGFKRDEVYRLYRVILYYLIHVRVEIFIMRQMELVGNKIHGKYVVKVKIVRVSITV